MGFQVLSSQTIPAFSIFTAIAMRWWALVAQRLCSIEVGKGNTTSGQTLLVNQCSVPQYFSTISVSIALYFLNDMIALMGASGLLRQN
ncbi:hypothetical protein O9929_15040 [Vibrio lentus]|nr:hypothetical protein [Vibrio lentus]